MYYYVYFSLFLYPLMFFIYVQTDFDKVQNLLSGTVLRTKKTKQQEHLLKQKQEEQEATAVYEEFVKSFEVEPDVPKIHSQAFVRGGTFDPSLASGTKDQQFEGREREDEKTGSLYTYDEKLKKIVLWTIRFLVSLL